MKEQKYEINSNYIVEDASVLKRQICLWNPNLGARRTLNKSIYSILCRFAFPRSIQSVMSEFPEQKRQVVLEAIKRLIDEELLIPYGIDHIRPTLDYSTRGMFSVPFCTFNQAIQDSTIDEVIVGVEYDAGVSNKAGAKMAPNAIREISTSVFTYDQRLAGMWDPCQRRRVLNGVKIVDIGNIGPQVQSRNGAVFDQLRTVISSIKKSGKAPIVVGGDHSITFAIAQGYIDAGCERFGILHFDAHSDYYTNCSGDEWKTKLHHGNVMSWISGLPEVSVIAQFGIRQLTAEDPTYSSKIKCWPGRESLSVRQEDWLALLDINIPWHITIDVDVLDPSVLPATGTPLPCGLFPDELLELLNSICHKRNILGADIVELIGGEDFASSLTASKILLHECELVAQH